MLRLFRTAGIETEQNPLCITSAKHKSVGIKASAT
jgi:hypothetical protein